MIQKKLNIITFALTALILLPLSSGCIHHEPRPFKGFFKNKSIFIGHRGVRTMYPENTLAAFRPAFRKGYAVELDVRLAKTGEVVIIHDKTVEKTTNGRGLISDMTLAEIKHLDAGYRFTADAGKTFPFRGKNIRIPTLDEVLQENKERNIIDIEIKYRGPMPKAVPLVEGVIEQVKKHKQQKNVFVSSFNPYILELFRKKYPELPRAQVYMDFEKSDIPFYEKMALGNLMLNYKADPDFLVAHKSLIKPGYLEKQRKRGYQVLIWTINQPGAAAEHLKQGAAGIITDNPLELGAIHEKKGSSTEN